MFALNYLKSDSFNESTKTWNIKRANKEDNEDILEYVKENFLKNEPLARALIKEEKPQLLMEVFRDLLDQGLSVVARRNVGNHEVVGVCINSKSTKDSGKKLLEYSKKSDDLKLKKLLETLATIETESNLNEKLNEVEIFALEVLSVHENYWGQGVRKDLIRESFDVAGENKLHIVKANCVNEFSRVIAERFKLTKAWSESYDTLLNQGEIKPFSFPEHPHHNAYVYYLDLQLPEVQKQKNPSFIKRIFRTSQTNKEEKH